jgi:hypothetical protein
VPAAREADTRIMRGRRLTALLCAALASAAATVDAVAGPPIELPALTRVASRLSGLTATMKISVVQLSQAAMQKQAIGLLDRDYPPDQQAYDETVYRAIGLLGSTEPLRTALTERYARNVLGLYDPVTHRLYVEKGARRSTVLHELVHALQDQSFDLRRLSSLRRGSRDGALAASAAVEGDAAFATQVLGGRYLAFSSAGAERRPASHGGSRIRLFLGLEQEFSYTTGARFIATLHSVGGNEAVFSALRTFPTTTEQIFHISSYLAREPAVPIALPDRAAGMTRVREDTWGELDVRALLAILQVPRLDHVGEGWGGGRTAVYRDASGQTSVALALDWDTELDAREWSEAVSAYVNEAFDADRPGVPPTVSCGSEACWNVNGHSVAIAHDKLRTVVVWGPTVAAADTLARELAGRR